MPRSIMRSMVGRFFCMVGLLGFLGMHGEDDRSLFDIAEKFYLGDTYTSQSYPYAFDLYKKVAQQRDDLDVAARAQARLGQIFFYGHGVRQNDDLARVLCEHAVSCPSFAFWEYRGQTQIILGQLYYTLARFDRARELFEQAAAQEEDAYSVAVAYVRLGEIYLYGFGVAVDKKRARRLLLHVISLMPIDEGLAVRAARLLSQIDTPTISVAAPAA